MIDEAAGKILGMALAYAASGLGLFVAYANYRKRIVKAERVMSPAAWGVVAVVALAIAGGVLVVSQLAQPPAAGPAPAGPSAETTAAAPTEPPAPPAVAAEPPTGRERSRWPLLGIVVPALLFLFATVITAALHRHFSARVAHH